MNTMLCDSKIASRLLSYMQMQNYFIDESAQQTADVENAIV